MDFRNEKAKKLKQGAIRAMFDRAATMTDVISMGIGEPDMPTPELVCRAGAEALQQGLTHYTPNAGTMQLRRAIAERASVAPVGYDPAQEIIITNGGMGALSLLFLVILNDGDEILIQDPQWLNYVAQVQYCGGVPVRVPTKAEDRFAMQPDVIESLITPRTKAIMVNSPNNPTGEVYSDEQLAAIAAIAEKHDLLVISDEVYNTLLYTGAKFRSIAELPGMKARTVVVNSFSKSYAMTGWRIGYAAAPAKIAKAMSSFQSHSTSNANSIAQHAAAVAMTNGEAIIADMVKEFAARRDLLVRLIAETPLLKANTPEGAFYVMLNISGVLGKRYQGAEITGSDSFAEMLINAKQVAVVPGKAFGADDHVRMSYAISRENIAEGMRRIAEFVSELE